MMHPTGISRPQSPPQPALDATHLFLRDDKVVRGPLPIEALQAKHRRGELRRDMLVSPDRVRWVATVDLPQLFEPQYFPPETPTSLAQMKWFYVSEGRKHGPVGWDELQTMAADGQLTPLDSVYHEGGKQWLPARHVDGLTFQSDQSVFGNKTDRRWWFAGAMTFVVFLMVIPAVLMLTWDEGRITDARDERLIDEEREYEQAVAALEREHENVMQRLEREHQENITRIEADATVTAAELNAKAVGAQIEREERLHRENIEAENQRREKDRAAADRRASEARAAEDARHRDAQAAADRRLDDAKRDAQRRHDEAMREIRN